MSKHTPGPWGIEFTSDSASILNRQDDTDNWEVCEVYRTDTAVGKANLSLLHAAPDLLKALEECLPCLGWENDDLEELQREHELGNGYAELIIRARAAIARAKGEA